ncbi:protein of unknown function [Methylocaldum szegediense]|uniref:Uncharacterized protein n=1 Tax=Methylocaldum szegediense TaxID=73780 RepID=A0ABM9I752_9GAMM|nr:protein of unknown function [Methylocaldum szegediense]
MKLALSLVHGSGAHFEAADIPENGRGVHAEGVAKAVAEMRRVGETRVQRGAGHVVAAMEQLQGGQHSLPGSEAAVGESGASPEEMKEP